jgi:hypothetical protein
VAGVGVILVDKPQVYQTRLRYKTWSHMVTDADSFDELHAMAERIGLRREWFQGDHYDVTPSRRAAAVKLGAVAVSSRELVQRRLRKDGTHGIPCLRRPA